ncbi:uncharacterized protein [Narcine bancroftii]|uniref:uncharacterized protein n=1 Tax=Narcine bancroftii TaxID=1343680 RepID=UPI003831E1A2
MPGLHRMQAPRFFHPPRAHVMKATLPFECLSIDFKGPLPSTNRNDYFLAVIDKYSRFPFAILCPDTSTATVIRALTQIFTLFGYPTFIHSDRVSSFMSEELRQYLTARGIVTSCTTSYNPRGNGQVEHENGVIWKAVLLALKSKAWVMDHWQDTLPEALHAIRPLLCTAANETSHEYLFSFPRKSVTGISLPAWLTSPEPILLHKHAWAHLAVPMVEQVFLLQANHNYTSVMYPNGRENTVSTWPHREHLPRHSSLHCPRTTSTRCVFPISNTRCTLILWG